MLARPNLGVVSSSIIVTRGLCRQPYEIDFSDPQMHLPCPESFANYTLANGLSVQAVKPPGEYVLKYENALGACRFELRFEAIHQAFDPHDPAENPLAEAAAAQPADARLGDHWSSGHFEVKGHITGELELRGQRYEVDYYDGMDHSWGPRKEVGTRSVSWISVNFAPDFGMHLAVPMTLRNGMVAYDPVRFGFVAEGGETYGITEATVEAERADMLAVANHIRAVDVRGKVHEFYGTVVGGHPWYTFNPSHVCFQVLMRYRQGDRVGYGEFGDIFGLDYLSERMSRSGRDR